LRGWLTSQGRKEKVPLRNSRGIRRREAKGLRVTYRPAKEPAGRISDSRHRRPSSGKVRTPELGEDRGITQRRATDGGGRRRRRRRVVAFRRRSGQLGGGDRFARAAGEKGALCFIFFFFISVDYLLFKIQEARIKGT
jgi:hypothetical protein